MLIVLVHCTMYICTVQHMLLKGTAHTSLLYVQHMRLLCTSLAYVHPANYKFLSYIYSTGFFTTRFYSMSFQLNNTVFNVLNDSSTARVAERYRKCLCIVENVMQCFNTEGTVALDYPSLVFS